MALVASFGSAILVTSGPVAAATCTPTSDIEVGGARIVTFTQVGTCTFALPDRTAVDILIVGGGGGGAASDVNNIGGGGGGGVAHGTNTLGSNLPIIVGDGGIGGQSGCGRPTAGESSSISDGASSVIADGGGAGAGCGDGGDGGAGGSGGGAHPWNEAHSGGTATKGSVVDTSTSSTAVVLLGNGGGSAPYGRAGGGGGGAGGAAPTVAADVSVGGAGGAGFTSSITGTATVYGSGGGGSGFDSGGLGGVNAGNGGGDIEPSTAGVDGTGGGGGAGCYGNGGGCAGNSGGSAGGSGIVVIRFSSGPGDPATLIEDYLDGTKEFPIRRFLLARVADMTGASCRGAKTAFSAVVEGLVLKGTLSSTEGTELVASIADRCT